MTNYKAIVKVNTGMPYAAFRRDVAQHDIPKDIPPLIEILKNTLQNENIKTNGECFFRYLSCTDDGQVTIEVGFPIEKTYSKFENIVIGSFPEGKYLSVMHTGDYKNLINAHMYLENYSKSNNIPLNESKTATGVVWGCRAEIYLTDPALTPISDLKTEVLFLLK